MPSSQIYAAELTTFDVAPDGAQVRLNVREDTGEVASLTLPTHCLAQLLMTIPTILKQALRNLNCDDSVRVVHALEDFRVELGEISAAGIPQFILTLATSGGFAVSFSATEKELATLGDALCENLLPAGQVQATSQRLS